MEVASLGPRRAEMRVYVGPNETLALPESG